MDITGTTGPDELTGTTSDDLIEGGGGNDTLFGLGGGDWAIFSGPRIDYIVSYDPFGDITTVTDTITDRDGTDSLVGVRGLGFNDQGILVWTGTASADSLAGAVWNDVIRGLDGNDTLDGALGRDTLIGGGGNDTYWMQSDDLDTVLEEPGGGVDVYVVLMGTAYLAENVEDGVLIDSGFQLFGNQGANVLTGNVGNNMLTGNGGDDNLRGGAGSDTARFAGSSTEYAVTYDAFAGILTVLDTVADRDGTDLLEGIEFIEFADGVLAASTWGLPNIGTAGDDQLEGSAGNDSLWGLDGNDTLLGGGGNDTLFGGSGRDLLDGQSGKDRMIGLGGNDTYFVDSAGDVVIDSAGTRDAIFTTVSYTAPAGIEEITLIGGGVRATGNTGNNVLAGNELANTLNGLAGSDTLDGGAGADYLAGGLGADSFIFSAALGSGVDRITDFRTVDDTIRLDSAVFTALPDGSLDAGAFQSAARNTAASADARLLFNHVSRALLYDADGSGPTAPVQFALLTGLTGTLSASDFLVV